jgi:hypothetical protein
MSGCGPGPAPFPVWINDLLFKITVVSMGVLTVTLTVALVFAKWAWSLASIFRVGKILFLAETRLQVNHQIEALIQRKETASRSAIIFEWRRQTRSEAMGIQKTLIGYTLTGALVAAQVGQAVAAPMPTSVGTMKAMVADSTTQVHWHGGWGGWGLGAGIAGAIIGGAIASSAYGGYYGGPYYGYPGPYYGYAPAYYGYGPYYGYQPYYRAHYGYRAYRPYYGHSYGYYRPYRVYHRHHYRRYWWYRKPQRTQPSHLRRAAVLRIAAGSGGHGQLLQFPEPTSSSGKYAPATGRAESLSMHHLFNRFLARRLSQLPVASMFEQTVVQPILVHRREFVFQRSSPHGDYDVT